jgi:N-acetylneuraminate lyase
LAPEVVAAQAAFLAERAIPTVFITGSTGECHSLSFAEKLALYEAWAAAAPRHGIRVIAHVGGNAIEEGRELTRAASRLGFDAVSAMAPSYFKPASLSHLVDWCATLAAEAPGMPFYFYDIPVLTNVRFEMDAFLRAAPQRIPNLAGIKYTNPDLVAYRRCLDIGGGKWDLPWGVDETWLAALATGARGAVGSTYNFMPSLYRAMTSSFSEGDFTRARELQSLAIRVIDALAAIGYMGAVKGLLARMGLAVGPARQPASNPSPEQLDRLHEQLEAMGAAIWMRPEPAAALAHG